MRSLVEAERLKVRDLVAAGLSIEPSSRAAWLRQACRDLSDEAREEVESLLAAGSAADSFLRSPTVGLDPSAVAEVWDTAPGQQVGNYRLVRELGRGGFGTVWQGLQERPIRRDVAVKLINPGMDTRHVVARFEAERQALAMMDHPGIARVIDAGATPAGRPYFVMELVDGRPITEFCREAGTPLRQRLELFAAVCRAVQHAHQKGIIHRDIKPGNVLVCLQDGRPVPKVIDFGVAKALRGPLTDASQLTAPRQLVGTPQYVSPEQTDGGSGDVDTRTDVYGLGVLLYELLAGEPPFEEHWRRSPSLAELQRAVREVDPPPPGKRLSASPAPGKAALAKRVRGELDWIVMRAIEKSPDKRYPTADALAADIERHLANQPVEAGPPTLRYRAAKMLRRHRAAFGAAAALAVALTAGMVGTAMGFVSANRERDAAVAARSSEAHERALAEVAKRNALSAEAAARASAARADRDLKRLQSVHYFLHSSLIAGESSLSGPPVPAPPRAMLDALSARLSSSKEADPWVAAPIHLAVAQGYSRHSLFDKATEHWEAAIELSQKMDPPNATVLAMASANLGAALLDAERPLEAEIHLSRVPRLLERLDVHGLSRLKVGLYLSDLALARVRTGKSETSLDAWEMALALIERASTEVGPEEVDEALRDLQLTLSIVEDEKSSTHGALYGRFDSLTRRLALARGVPEVPLPLPQPDQPSTEIRTQARGIGPFRKTSVTYLREQLAADRNMRRLFADVATEIDEAELAREDVSFLFGPGLMRSGRATVVAGLDDQMFVLELSEEQRRLFPDENQQMGMMFWRYGRLGNRIRPPVASIKEIELYGGTQQRGTDLVLGRVKIDGIDVTKDFEVGLRMAVSGRGYFRTKVYYFDGRPAGADGWHEFAIEGPGDDVAKNRPMVVFFDLCKTSRDDQGEPRGNTLDIISGSVAKVFEFLPE